MKLRHVIALVIACLGGQARGAQITIDTTVIQAQQGYLDFQFTSVPFTPQVNLLLTNFNLFGGLLGTPQIFGDVTGSLDTTLSMSNAATIPVNELFVPVSFGGGIRFAWEFTGPGFTNPDGQTGPSDFTFSILDATGTQPLLLMTAWMQVDPGGYAVTLNLDNQGQVTFQSFLYQDLAPVDTAVPEPGPMAMVGLGLIVVGRKRIFAKWATLIALSVPIYSQDWRVGPVVPTPNELENPSMTYDSVRHEVVLFGGIIPGIGPRNETYVWDGAEWKQKTPQHRPSGRFWPAMAFDAAHGEVVLFGGQGEGVYGDTWTWNGMDWTQRFPAHIPPAVSGARMVYDVARGVTMMYGGDPIGALRPPLSDETWIWNGADWIKQTPVNSPGGRSMFSMGYDAQSGETVVYGGHDGRSPLSDTWIWNGKDWRQGFPAHSPGAMIRGCSTSGKILMGGGTVSNQDAWFWESGDWVVASRQHSPGFHLGCAMAFHAGRGEFALYGGTTGLFTSSIYSTGLNLSPQVQVTASALTLSRVTGTMVGTVTVKNIGSTPIYGPLSISLANLPLEVTAANPSGKSFGVPYFTVPGFDAQTALYPGNSVTVPVQLPQLTFTPVAYSGVRQ